MSDTPTTLPQSDDVIHPSKFTPVQGLILLICYVGYVLDGFDIAIISFAAPGITADWEISSQQLGLVFSAGLAGMTVGAMFFASLADIYGRRLVVSVAMIFAGLATCGVAYTNTVPQLTVLRFVSGLGLGVLAATLPPLAGEYSPRRHRAFIVGIMLSGASVGPAIGGLIAAPLIAEHGWKSIFFYAGALTTFHGLLLYFVVPESISLLIKRKPEGALEKVNKILKYIGQPVINAFPPAVPGESSESASVLSLLTPQRRVSTLLIWLTFSLGFGSVYFILSWTPQILVNAGFLQQQAIQGAVAFSLGAIIGTILIGWLARWGKLASLVTLSFAIAALVIIVLSFILRPTQDLSYGLAWAALFLLGLTLVGAFSNLYTISLNIYPAQVRSTGLGWAVGLGRGGGVISPGLAGLLIGAGVSMPNLLLLFAIPTFVAAFCVLLIDKSVSRTSL